MTKPTKNLLAALGALTLGMSASAFAQDSGALLDALVRKNILSAQEAEDVRSELLKENAATSAGKINLKSSVMEMALSGDLRLRYQYDNRKTAAQPPITDSGTTWDGNGAQRSRERFRLRLNADFKLTDNIFGGVQLQTNNASDSANQTFGTAFGNYNIYISRAFVGWNATDWMTIVAGKQANPFYTTDLVWDPDINPEGLVERIEFHKLFGSRTESTSSDGKGSYTTSSVRSLPNWELSLVAGQFIFQDNNDFDPGENGDDVWLFAGQLVGSYKFTPQVKATFAPGIMAYTAGRVTSANNETQFNNGATISTGKIRETGAQRNLVMITAPGEVAFKLFGQKTKVLWDFSYNTKGAERARDNYGMLGDLAVVRKNGSNIGTTGASGHKSQDDIAWLAGFQVGENKKKGDWSVFANYRQTGLTSVDPNLNDSDFALGQLNSEGFKVGASYNLTDSVVFGATYFNANRLRKDLTGGQATKGNKLSYLSEVQIVQLDLNVKF